MAAYLPSLAKRAEEYKLALTSPTNGTVLQAGSTFYIRWSPPIAPKVFIYLFNADVHDEKYAYQSLGANILNTGVLTWKVPQTICTSCGLMISDSTNHESPNTFFHIITPATTFGNSTNPDPTSNLLSAAAIAGISLGAIGVAIAILLLIFLILSRKTKTSINEPGSSADQFSVSIALESVAKKRGIGGKDVKRA